MKVSGGRTIYGATVGILMLEARFPRVLGDTGNALTWPFPVQYRVVPAASPDRVVRRGAEGLLPAFIASARELVAAGCDGITTTCGFLSLFQDEIAGAVGVPVATSSLMQAPLIQRLLPPGRRVGILTISAATLKPAHLEAAGVDPATPVHGTDGGREFSRAILGDEADYDTDLARQDNVAAAQELRAAHPDIGALLLECTNMVPFAADVARATGLPVYSMYSFVTWFQAGLAPRRFADGFGDGRGG